MNDGIFIMKISFFMGSNFLFIFRPRWKLLNHASISFYLFGVNRTRWWIFWPYWNSDYIVYEIVNPKRKLPSAFFSRVGSLRVQVSLKNGEFSRKKGNFGSRFLLEMKRLKLTRFNCSTFLWDTSVWRPGLKYIIQVKCNKSLRENNEKILWKPKYR